MDTLETIKKYGYTAKIEVDPDPDSPRSWGRMGSMVSWHRRKIVGDRDGLREGLDPAEFTAELREQNALIVPVYMLEHSGSVVQTTPFNDPWDSGQVGIIYATPEEIVKEFGSDTPETREQARLFLVGEVETYNQWASGDVYGFIIEDAAGEHVDSCWGFYGLDYIREEVNRRLEELPHRATTREPGEMVEIATATCGFCRQPITGDLDERSTLDWGDNGDYGCGNHPLSDDEGTYGHVPAEPRAVTLMLEVQGSFAQGKRGPEYVEEARQMAQRLGIGT